MQAAQKGPVIVERSGKPEVVVLSVSDYENLVAGNAPGGISGRLVTLENS